MKHLISLPLLALGLAFAAAVPAAAQSANDFQLPPNPAPSSTPRPQGPVDDSGVVPIGPRAIPTASPTLTPRPTAEPTPTPTPAPSPRPTGSSTAIRSQAPVRTDQPFEQPVPAATAPSGPSIADPLPPQPDTDGNPTPSLDLPDTTATTAASEADSSPPFTLPEWWWIAALAAGLAALLAVALVFWRRRRAAAPAPEIERPRLAGIDSEAQGDPLRYLKVEIEAVRISRSVMASTLSYRITLTNRAATSIRNISLDGDLTSAHGRAPIAEQMADTLTALPQVHVIDHLGPGQRKSFTGDLRLELRNVRPIQQGNVPIYIPLVRLKASAAAAEPKAFTFVVGKRPGQPGGRLQPFRLDTPPQTYAEIDARPLT
ncbi:hypothetical protein [Parerythrobacter aestuarii]|uniref:hypothetical protein n=1 Tax=Parerythrobacter aestuarii TaxID=3020909 RepID=UPI0024DDFA3B|nr:hypothetical protein [Parerythrobacter aestuarii]